MTNQDGTSFSHKFITGINIAYTIAILIWVTLQTFWGDQWWLLYLFNTIAIYLFIPLLGQIFAALWLRKKIIWLCFGTVFLIGIYHFGGLFIPKFQNQPPSTSITIMTSNVLAFRDNPEAFISSVKQANTDIIAIQELNPSIAEDIKTKLTSEYPYQILEPSISTDGMGLLSKYPIKPETTYFTDIWFVGIPQAYKVEIQGKEILIVNFHAYPPEPLQECFRQVNILRNDEVSELLSLIRKQESPVILLGDLNETEKNDNYQLITTYLVDAWRKKGFGLGNTHINVIENFPPKWFVRIDYIFHSPELETVSAEIGPWDGYSDHRPVVAEIGFK